MIHLDGWPHRTFTYISYIHRIVTNLWMLYVSYYIRTVYIINVSNDASPIGIGSTMKRIVEWGKSSMCQTAISNQPLSAILKISSYTKRLMPGLLSYITYAHFGCFEPDDFDFLVRKRIVKWSKSSMCQTAISNQPLSAILKISSYRGFSVTRFDFTGA